MEKIEKLETAVGKSIEQWNVSDLEIFSKEENLELLQYLREPEVISECLTRSKQNRDVADILVPLYVKSLLSEAENCANNLLRDLEEKKISKPEVKEKAIEMTKNNSFYYRITGYLMLISMFPEYDIKEHEVDIKECIGNLKEVVCGLTNKSLDSCYSLIMDLLELIFPIRAKYYEVYKVDILDDSNKELEQALDAIHTLELTVMKELQKLEEQSSAQENGGEGNSNE